MSSLSVFVANLGAYLILFLIFAGCGLAAIFVGIMARKKKDEKDAAADGKVTESET